MASKTTFKYYVYSETPVVSYIKDGRMGVYAFNALTRTLERDGIYIGYIDFDRSGLARKLNRKEFLKLVREKGVLEFPEDIAELNIAKPERKPLPMATKKRGDGPAAKSVKKEPVTVLSRKNVVKQASK